MHDCCFSWWFSVYRWVKLLCVVIFQVRDEEGRRRFHGAFTGGYSAGYYNTVGSKEGNVFNVHLN